MPSAWLPAGREAHTPPSGPSLLTRRALGEAADQLRVSSVRRPGLGLGAHRHPEALASTGRHRGKRFLPRYSDSRPQQPAGRLHSSTFFGSTLRGLRALKKTTSTPLRNKHARKWQEAQADGLGVRESKGA